MWAWTADSTDSNVQVCQPDARYLLGVSYPSSERQHVLNMKTIGCGPGVCADRASAIDALELQMTGAMDILGDIN